MGKVASNVEEDPVADKKQTFWRRHRWLTALGLICVVIFAAFTIAAAVLARRFQPLLRAALVQGLEDHFHTRVELDGFRVALGNGLHGEWGIWATGKGLRIWPPRHTGGDMPLEISVQSIPLISLDQFRFHVPLRYERGKPVKISRVRLEGLKIVVPPRSERDKQTGIESALTRPTPGAESAHQSGPALEQATNQKQGNAGQSGAGTLSNVVVERIECERAELILETDKPNKLPLGFEIAHLTLRDVRAQGPMKFEADLINPKPRGFIHSSGTLGPWQAADPGETAVSGTYTFDHADLATFKGIAGILSSKGEYAGTLREITVDGNADVPDFRLPQFGNPVQLHTQFHARVDGTDGDTWLDPVDATLGHSHFTTRGEVVRVRPAGHGGEAVTSAGIPPLADFGHDINLKVDIDRGRIEDFLRLANHAETPILTGALVTKATLHIPPGPGPAHERIRLDGEFKLENARFSDVRVQGKIESLSLRGQGRPQDVKSTDPNEVTSEMEGEFHMADSVITLPDLHYNVPGAAIELKGRYPLEGFMHFDGTARMQATVSKMVGGWKGFLLKPADRFFKKEGAGTVVPILIRGPHDQPEFSVDFGRMKHSSPETPGQAGTKVGTQGSKD
jgi:hypothetical protein